MDLSFSCQTCLQAALEESQAEVAHSADNLANLTAEAGARLAADEQVGIQARSQVSATAMCMLLCCDDPIHGQTCTRHYCSTSAA